MSSSPPLQNVSVRNIAFMFEAQTIPVKNERTNLVKRTKSMGHLLRKPTFDSSSGNMSQPTIPELNQLESQVKNLRTELQNYQQYSKDNHSYLQTQVLLLLTEVVNVESRDQEVVKRRKGLIDDIQQINKSLISRLPVDNKIITNEKVVVNSTNSTLNKAPKSNKHKKVVDQVITDVPLILPSVKNLKNVFEAKREENGGTGLNIIASQNKSPRKVLSFNGSTCDVKYVPYNERVKSTNAKYVVEDDQLNKKRVVHNTTLQRRETTIKEEKVVENYHSDKKKVLQRSKSMVESLKAFYESKPVEKSRKKNFSDDDADEGQIEQETVVIVHNNISDDSLSAEPESNNSLNEQGVELNTSLERRKSFKIGDLKAYFESKPVGDSKKTVSSDEDSDEEYIEQKSKDFVYNKISDDSLLVESENNNYLNDNNNLRRRSSVKVESLRAYFESRRFRDSITKISVSDHEDSDDDKSKPETEVSADSLLVEPDSNNSLNEHGTDDKAFLRRRSSVKVESLKAYFESKPFGDTNKTANNGDLDSDEESEKNVNISDDSLSIESDSNSSQETVENLKPDFDTEANGNLKKRSSVDQDSDEEQIEEEFEKLAKNISGDSLEDSDGEPGSYNGFSVDSIQTH